MTDVQTHDKLVAAADAAQATLDRKRAHHQRAIRYFDECPDGDRRKPDAEARMVALGKEASAAERAAMDAADALIAYEETPGTHVAEQTPTERLGAWVARAAGMENPTHADVDALLDALQTSPIRQSLMWLL